MSSAAVDPAILRVVGDVGRPERGCEIRTDTRHIRGNDGLLAGLASLWAWTRHGHAHLQMQAKKHGPLYRGQVGTDRFVFVDLFARVSAKVFMGVGKVERIVEAV